MGAASQKPGPLVPEKWCISLLQNSINQDAIASTESSTCIPFPKYSIHLIAAVPEKRKNKNRFYSPKNRVAGQCKRNRKEPREDGRRAGQEGKEQ